MESISREKVTKVTKRGTILNIIIQIILLVSLVIIMVGQDMFQKFSTIIVSLGFLASYYNSALFARKTNVGCILLSLYVAILFGY